MFILFFIIIFIAELIITTWIVSWIQKADAAVCQANLNITKAREKLHKQLNKINAVIHIANLSIDYTIIYIKETKTHFYNFFNKKNFIITLLFLILKIPQNQISRCIDIFMIIKNTYLKIFVK